jgi:enoyl-CoA hydratase/carnithine racemase
MSATNDDAPLTLERRGHVLLMGFNRPAKRNAFGVDTYLQLAAAYGELDRDPELRCGLVFGHGPHFTAGLDLTQWAPLLGQGKLADLPEGAIEPFGLDESRRLRKPLVMAAEGVSFTVAVELMLAADIRVAATEARFAQLEVKRGFYACGGATLRLVQEIGWGNAQRYLLTGDEFSGSEAYRMGLVQELTEPGQALARALEIAERVAAAAPLGVQASLASSRLARIEGDRAALARLYTDLRPVMASEDAREAVQAFAERRQAVFKGR